MSILNFKILLSIDDLKSLFTNGAFETWLTDSASNDLDAFRCIERVPRATNIFGIEGGMFIFNA